jgi:hypothetical protein
LYYSFSYKKFFEEFIMLTKWVLISKVIDLIGYTDDAIRAKIAKGVWLAGVHWTKAPDGRLMF